MLRDHVFMDSAMVEAVESIRNKLPKKRGPKTEAGTLRSALNSVKHGLTGGALLLPGDSQNDYQRMADGFFSALRPANDAEAELVALIVDDNWKLERLRRLEHGLLLGRVAELVDATPEGRKAATITDCLVTLGNALEAWNGEATEENKKNAGKLVAAVTQVSERLPAIPEHLRSEFDNAAGTLEYARLRPEDVLGARERLYTAARAVMSYLLDEGKSAARQVEAISKAASVMAIPDKAEMAKLGSYRRMIETGLQRRLLILDALQKVANRTTGQPEDSAREYRVKLRVVP